MRIGEGERELSEERAILYVFVRARYRAARGVLISRV